MEIVWWDRSQVNFGPSISATQGACTGAITKSRHPIRSWESGCADAWPAADYQQILCTTLITESATLKKISTYTLRMPPPQIPVTTPVTFSFDSGEIQLTYIIDKETEHPVTCDLCSQVIKLGIRGSINCISQHRDGEKCKRRAFKVSKLVFFLIEIW